MNHSKSKFSPSQLLQRAQRRLSLMPVLVLLLSFGWAQSGFALSTDRDKPIEIEADSAEADDAKGVTIYKGDVVIVQGTLKITGDKVTIYYGDDGDFTKMVTLGNPAHFDQLPDGKKDTAANYQRAKASRMEYIKKTDTIVLLGNAVYGQGGDKVAADRIDYDSRKGRMKASTQVATKKSGKKGRVRITLQPKKKSN